MTTPSSNNDRGAKWYDGDTTTGDVARATTDEASSKAEVQHARNYVWNSSTLQWDRMTQAGGGGGGGGDASAANQTLQLAQETAINTHLTDGSARIGGTVAVSGPLTDTQLRASAVPVSGTFFQATQPVSGTVAISGSVAVTGPLTDTQLRASAVPVSLTSTTITGSVAVTGTFFQATQPVSIAGTVAVSGPLTDTQLRASAVPVSGPLTDTQLRASSVPTSETNLIADNAAFVDGTSKVFPNGFIFDEVAGTALTENDIGAARMDSKRALVNVLEDATTRGQRQAVSAAGAAKVNINPGRTYVSLYADNVATVTGTAAMLTFLKNVAGTVTSGVTAYTVTAGKTFRVQSLVVSLRNGTAAANYCRFRFHSDSGTPTITSPVVEYLGIGTNSALADATVALALPIAEGIDLAAGTQIGFSQLGTSINGLWTFTLTGYEY